MINQSKFSKFIHKLQQSPENVKKRWLFGASGASIIILIGLWAFYLNMTLPRIAGSEEKVEIIENNEDSFFDILKKGVLNIKDDIGSRWGVFNTETKSLIESLEKNTESPNQ